MLMLSNGFTKDTTIVDFVKDYSSKQAIHLIKTDHKIWQSPLHMFERQSGKKLHKLSPIPSIISTARLVHIEIHRVMGVTGTGRSKKQRVESGNLSHRWKSIRRNLYHPQRLNLILKTDLAIDTAKIKMER